MSAWFEIEDEKNSNVYVSGLPDDITMEEFKELMTKVGVIAYDPIYRKPKLKLYTNPDGSNKGDGRCCYIKVRRISWCFREFMHLLPVLLSAFRPHCIILCLTVYCMHV